MLGELAGELKLLRRIGDELYQIEVWIAAINTLPNFVTLVACAGPLDGAQLDVDPRVIKKGNGAFNRSFPDKTKIATARHCVWAAGKACGFPCFGFVEIKARLAKHNRMDGQIIVIERPDREPEQLVEGKHCFHVLDGDRCVINSADGHTQTLMDQTNKCQEQRAVLSGGPLNTDQ